MYCYGSIQGGDGKGALQRCKFGAVVGLPANEWLGDISSEFSVKVALQHAHVRVGCSPRISVAKPDSDPSNTARLAVAST